MIIVDPALARVPNSPTDTLVLIGSVEGPPDRLRTVATGSGFSFSLLEAVLRRKLRPSIDRRPSGDGNALSTLGDAKPTTLFDEDLREKKGIPDGVRRGLRRDDLERPGLMATTEGVGSETLPRGFVAVPPLLMLEVRVRGTSLVDALSVRSDCRTLAPSPEGDVAETGDLGADPFEARPAISFVEPASRRGYQGSER